MFDFIKDKTKYNSFSVIFVLFLYSLATLPGAFLSTGVVIIALAILIIAPALCRNFSANHRVFFKAIALQLCLLAYLGIDMLQYPQYSESTSGIIVSLATIGSVGLLTGCMDYDEVYIMKYGRILALVNFVTTSLFLSVSSDLFSLSMRFGYAMLPSAIWFLFEVLQNKKMIFLPLFLISTLMLTVWGSRGTLLVLGLFLMLALFYYRKIAYILLLVLLWVFRDFFIDIALQFCLYLADLTGAHKISGIISILSGDLWETTGGRDNLYEYCWNMFLNNPLGNGVCFWASDNNMNFLYPHNVILQIAAESGLFGLIAFFITVVIIIRRLYSTNKNVFLLYAVFVSIALGRLLVSSNFWERPEFWLLIGLFVINPKLKYNIQ